MERRIRQYLAAQRQDGTPLASVAIALAQQIDQLTERVADLEAATADPGQGRQSTTVIPASQGGA
jgi:hypothetical protein